MRPWYEPRKNRPDIAKDARQKKGLLGFLEIIWREFFALIGLNLIFVVFCIPIITIPAALTAMSRITVTMVQDKNYFIFADFWKAFKRDFGKSLGGGILLLLLMIVFSFSTTFYYQLAQGNYFFLALAAFSACLVLAVLMTGFYFFPMLAMVDLKLKPLLKNSLVMAFACFKRTIPALIYFVILVGACVLLLPQSTLFILLILFSLVNLTTSYMVCQPIEERILGKPAQSAPTEAASSGDENSPPELESAVIGEFPDLDDEEKQED